MRLDGRAVLVTGGSRGIGRAIATRLAAEGAAVAVNYRSRAADAAEVVDEITANGGRAVALPADVSEAKEARELVRRTIEELGDLHTLVNNAGVVSNGLIYDQDPDDWWQVFRTNVLGVFNCTQAAAEHLMGRRTGSIVNISSVMGEQGWVGQSNYAASKGAVNAFTRASATEFSRFGVRVNAVLPGWTPTGLLGSLLDKERGRNIRRQLPLRDFATAEQVAAATAFLASDDAAYTTGELLHVDGGWTAQLGLGRPKTEGGR
ncbi:SDR family NAD(P)-dependent oxidoreductase [Streptomyces sp. NPDC001595]|uniref:SDR family NAD(P)-dependent oxidoreductase n=1 Tax=Streptomyces sp. NPDC001532 TaxID=3154520 RepID=UPI003324DAB8